MFAKLRTRQKTAFHLAKTTLELLHGRQIVHHAICFLLRLERFVGSVVNSSYGPVWLQDRSWGIAFTATTQKLPFTTVFPLIVRDVDEWLLVRVI